MDCMHSINQCVLFLFPTAFFGALKDLKIRFKKMLRFDDWFDCKTKNYITGVKILTPKKLQLVFGSFYVLLSYRFSTDDKVQEPKFLRSKDLFY